MDNSASETATVAAPPDSQATTRDSVSRFDRWRGVFSRIALIVFMVTAGLAVPTIWVRNQVLDTDAFVRTVAPLGGDPSFQVAIVNNVTTGITREVASSSIVSDSDGIVSALLPVVTTAAVDSVATSVVTSPDFPTLWEDVARTAHRGFVALVNGTDSPNYDTSNGQITIDLAPVAQAVTDELSSRGINVNPPSRDLSFVIFESSRLSNVQTFTKNLNELAIIFTIVALASLIAYIILSPNRRGAIVVAGLGLAISMLVVLLFVMLLRWLYLRDLSESVDKDAARGMFDILTNYLRWGLRLIGLGGLIVAGIGYLVFRDRLHIESNDEARRSLYEHWPSLGKLENTVATNKLGAVGVWLALMAGLLFLLDWTDFAWVITVLVVGIAGLVIILRAKPVPAELLKPVKPTIESAAAEGGYESVSHRLQQVSDLRSDGALSQEEFDQAKALILAGG